MLFVSDSDIFCLHWSSATNILFFGSLLWRVNFIAVIQWNSFTHNSSFAFSFMLVMKWRFISTCNWIRSWSFSLDIPLPCLYTASWDKKKSFFQILMPQILIHAKLLLSPPTLRRHEWERAIGKKSLLIVSWGCLSIYLVII